MSLAKKKLEVEMARVYAARLDMELKLEELGETQARIQRDIQIQLDREAELEIKIKELEGE